MNWDADLYMAPQQYSWTCAACSLDWVLRSTGLASPSHTPDQAVVEIGVPDNINPQYGLMDASGAALGDVYTNYGQATERAWLDFDTLLALAEQTTGQISGAGWYHWVALRGVMGDALWIANSAPGYKGIYDVLGRSDFARLGPFSAVWLTD